MSTEETLPIISHQNQETSENNDENERLRNENVDNNDSVENDEDGESWYGWVVVAACFLCNMVIDGMGYSFGVMLQPLMHEFHVGAGQVAFVGSILNGVVMLSAPVAAACINRFGSRITCVVGSLISSVAVFLSSYSTSLTLLLLTYGVLGGVGLGLMYAPAVVTVGQYFTRRLNLATGICVCGSGAGTFLFAPIASTLIAKFGWRGCNRVMAVFCLFCSLLGLIMAPNVKRRRAETQREDENKNKKLIDISILKDIPFVLYIVSNIPILMAVYSVYSYIPAMGESRGLGPDEASFLISMIGITNTVGRVISGWISDIPCVSPIIVNILATLVSIMFPVLLSLDNTYPIYLTISALTGLVLSPLPTVTSGIITSLLGSDKLNDAFGILTFVRGGSALLGPPLAGYLSDYHHDFSLAFILSSVQFGASFIICTGAWLVLRRSFSQRPGYQQLE